MNVYKVTFTGISRYSCHVGAANPADAVTIAVATATSQKPTLGLTAAQVQTIQNLGALHSAS